MFLHGELLHIDWIIVDKKWNWFRSSHERNIWIQDGTRSICERNSCSIKRHITWFANHFISSSELQFITYLSDLYFENRYFVIWPGRSRHSRNNILRSTTGEYPVNYRRNFSFSWSLVLEYNAKIHYVKREARKIYVPAFCCLAHWSESKKTNTVKDIGNKP